jgi:hypothetical protein
LGADDVEILLDLGEKGLTGPSLIFLTQGELNANTL